MVTRLSDVVGGGYADFWHSKHRYRMSIGGRASKKSTTAALSLVSNIMRYQESNALVMRKIYKDHKDSTYAQLKWAINRLGVQDRWDAKLSPLELTYLPTGQKIIFRGLDDPMSITSITVEHGYLCFCWFEEIFQVTSERDFDMVDGSIRGQIPSHLFKQITGTMNPWNDKHWIKRRFFDHKSKDVFTKVTTYKINEFIDDADRRFFEQMRLKNPRRYKVEGLGQWGQSEGLIFSNWREEKFDYREIAKDRPNVQAAFGLDFGFTTDPTGFIAMLVDMEKRQLFWFDEHYASGMLNPDIAMMIKQKGYQKERIVADSAEPKSIKEIKNLGIDRITAAEKGKDSVEFGIKFMQEFEIVVHPKLTNAIFELNTYATDPKTGKPIDDYNHIIDPARYALERFSKGSAMRPLKGQEKEAA